MRVSRTRVVGSVVLLRKKGGRPAGAARRSLRVLVDRPVRSILTQRNVLRRRAPRSAGVGAAQLGPIVCVTNEELMKGTQIHSEVVFRDEDDEAIPDAVFADDTTALGYGLYCDVYSPGLSPLLESIGSRFPVSCTFSSTYIGAATDSEGNVLTEPSFVFGLQCSKTIDELALVVHDAYVKMCQDAEDRPCMIGMTTTLRDTALFPYRIQAGLDASVVIRGDPPFEKGDRIEIVIDLVDGAQMRDEQVM